MSAQKRILLLLVAVFLLSLGYAFWKMPRQERVATHPVRARSDDSTAAADKKTATAGEVRVRLELLERTKEKSPGFRRDIFRFPEPEKPKEVKKEPPPPPPPPPPPQPVVEPVVPVAVQRELSRFTFLGFLEKKGEKTIFLSLRDEIFLVKKDDTFGEAVIFRVVSLTPETLTIREGDDPRPIVIPLVEKAPLVATERLPSEGENPVRGVTPPQQNLNTEGGRKGGWPGGFRR